MLTRGHNARVLETITANTIVLIIVALAAAAALAGMVIGVRYTCRNDRAAGDRDAKAQAAQIDSDIEAFRHRARRRSPGTARSEAAQLRQQLDDRTDRSA